MKKTVQGSCLCGVVNYQITGHLGIFQYCHCSRCRKFTGSAHAANLIVGLEQFNWVSGYEQVGYFAPEDTKHFATGFCKHCGSSLPWQAKTGKAVVIPAGSLDDYPDIEPSQNIFYASKASWYRDASDLPKHETLPKK